MQSIRAFFLIVLVSFAVVSCSNSNSTKERTDKAAVSKGDIVIGIVGSSEDRNFFVEGVKLAVDEINEKGGVLGREIRPIYFDDKGTREQGSKIARKLSNNSDIVGVIGHMYSNVAIPVSITYALNGILFISPGATDPFLTRLSSEYIFRNIPTDEEIGRQAADFAKRSGFKKMVVFYQRDNNTKRLADIFQESALENGMEIVVTRSFFKWQTNFRFMLSSLKSNYEFDSIFLAGVLPSAGYLIKQARDIGIHEPILGGDGLDSPSLWTIAGKAAEGTSVATVFNPEASGVKIHDFVNKFEATYGFEPDTWAAQGYDAVSVYASVVDEVGSSVPIVVSSAMKFLKDWVGATGTYSFTRGGNVSGKSIYFKTVNNEKFVFHHDDLEEKLKLYDYAVDYSLRLPLEKYIQTVDPGQAYDAISVEVVEQLFLGLTDFDTNTYKAVPELATDWIKSKDGRKYTFHLRRDAIWTNGVPVLAHDVVWAIKRNISIKQNAAAIRMLSLLKNGKAIHEGDADISLLGVRALDLFTVEFELQEPVAFFPAVAGLPIFSPLPQAVIEEFGDNWTTQENIVTNGPYNMGLWDRGNGMVLIKNDGFYDKEKVLIPEVRYFVVAESHLGLALYEKNDFDILGGGYLPIPFDQIANVKSNPAFANDYSLQPSMCTYAYAFNLNRPIVASPLVRKAISAVIDRRAIVDTLTGGGAIPATTFTTLSLLGDESLENNSRVRFDPVQAAKWFVQSGVADRAENDELTVLYENSYFNKSVAEAIKASITHYLGIPVKLIPQGRNEYSQSMSSDNNAEMFLVNWCADYADANNFLGEAFNPDHPVIQTGWHNETYKKLVTRAKMEVDPQIRKSYYRSADKILSEEDAILVPIFYQQIHSLVKPRVGGWNHMALGGQHIRNWYFREQ